MKIPSISIWLCLYYQIFYDEKFVKPIRLKPKNEDESSGFIQLRWPSNNKYHQLNIPEDLLSKNPLSVKFETEGVDNKNLKEDNLSLYELTKVEGDNYSYKFPENSKCIEVKYKGHLVWSYKEERQKYPSEVIFNTSTKHIDLHFEDGFKQGYVHYERNEDMPYQKASGTTTTPEYQPPAAPSGSPVTPSPTAATSASESDPSATATSADQDGTSASVAGDETATSADQDGTSASVAGDETATSADQDGTSASVAGDETATSADQDGTSASVAGDVTATPSESQD